MKTKDVLLGTTCYTKVKGKWVSVVIVGKVLYPKNKYYYELAYNGDYLSTLRSAKQLHIKKPGNLPNETT